MNNVTNNMTASSLLQQVEDTRRITQTFLIPLVTSLGFFGNCLTMLVLSRRRMRSSTNSYLTALAGSDSMHLLASFSLSLMHSVQGINSVEHRFYWIYWPYALWLADASSNTSTWLTVTFTVERYVAVSHPMYGQIYCTVARARRMIIAVFVFCYVSTISTPFEWTLAETLNPKNNRTEIVPEYSTLGQHPGYRLGFYWFTAVTFVVLPLILLAVFNIFLVAAVRRSRRERQNLTESSNDTRGQRNENKVTIMLIAVVLIYMLCQLPHACMLVYTAFADEPGPSTWEYSVRRILGNVFNLMMAFNSAVNFVLYCAFSDKYRSTVVAVLTGREWCSRAGTDQRGAIGTKYHRTTLRTSAPSTDRGRLMSRKPLNVTSPASSSKNSAIELQGTTGAGSRAYMLSKCDGSVQKIETKLVDEEERNKVSESCVDQTLELAVPTSPSGISDVMTKV